MIKDLAILEKHGENDIITCIRSIPGLLSLKGAEREEIALAEQSLGLHFSKEYVQYLQTFGCISFAGHEFTGLHVTDRLNVAAVTRFELQSKGTLLPTGSYVIETLDDEGRIIVQDSTGTIYETAPGTGTVPLASTFAGYLRSLI